MNKINPIVSLLLFPSGLALMAISLFYEFLNRKIIARFQNRSGPQWFQPAADFFKSLSKEEIIPKGVNRKLFIILPIVSFACVMTASLYVPIFGIKPSYSLQGDLIITIYLLSAMTMCLGLAGANSLDRFAVVGAVRTITQLFSYEAPFMLALLMPALSAQSWKISEITTYAAQHTWMVFTIPLGFIVAIIGLMGKLELPPFDAPEAESEIVSGALVEYSGRGLALFHIAKDIELVVGLSLIAAFYFGGIVNPFVFILKTVFLLLIIALFESAMTRFRIDQTVGAWWQIGALLALFQLLIIILQRTL